jgi:hypothetical protein
MGVIRVPVPEGRVHDDHLTPAERALVDFMADHLRDDRLRVVVRELLAIEWVRLEVLDALTEDE